MSSVPLRPAFRSPAGVAGFGATLLLFGVLPLVLSALPGYRPIDRYLATSGEAGDYGFIAREIYERTGDIDVLVLGSSESWTAYDTDYLQSYLSAELGRKAVVLNFGSNWRFEDAPYVFMRDLLARRRVRMVLFCGPRPHQRANTPHPASKFWWIPSEHRDLLPGLPFRAKLQLYTASSLGSARQVLSMLRRNSTIAFNSHQRPGAHVTETGALFSAIGFLGDDDSVREPFRHIAGIVRPDVPLDRILRPHGAPPDDRFVVEHAEPLSDYQRYFLQALSAELRRNHVHVAIVEVPYLKRGLRLDEHRVLLSYDWRQVFEGPFDLIGVPSHEMFSKYDKTDLFYDWQHMNRNGQELFTKIIAPAVVRSYEQAYPHDAQR